MSARAVASPILAHAAMALLTVCCAGSVRAEPAADRAVDLLKAVCVAPTTPEGMIDAGNQAAAAEGWNLIGAAPAPLPIMHNENGAKISFMSAWDVPLATGGRARLVISIIRPEIASVRHSVCILEPALEIGSDVLADAVEKQFGSHVVRDSRRWTGSRKWFFAEEKLRGNCGRSITLFEHKTPSLMYFDSAYPNDGNWMVPFSETLCRS